MEELDSKHSSNSRAEGDLEVIAIDDMEQSTCGRKCKDCCEPIFKTRKDCCKAIVSTIIGFFLHIFGAITGSIRCFLYRLLHFFLVFYLIITGGGLGCEETILVLFILTYILFHKYGWN